MERNKIYFASDFHLGTEDDYGLREKTIGRWLDTIQQDAAEVYLVGDIFDYWFEYENSIPKGHSIFLAKVRCMVESGIQFYFFRGNHDLWMFDYFPEEYGIPVYAKPQVKKIHGKTFYIGHGDGLGPKDHMYKLLKKVLTNSFCQWLFGMIHPSIGLRAMRYLSSRSRKKKEDVDYFLGPEEEWLVQHAQDVLRNQPVDYFIFGHRHLPIDYALTEQSRYINLGDWIRYNSYAVYDGVRLEYKFFENEDGKVLP